MFKKILSVFLILVSILSFCAFDISNSTSANAEEVIVNFKRHIYHTLSCKKAKKCKKSCIKAEKATAISKYKARPCKICHKKK